MYIVKGNDTITLALVGRKAFNLFLLSKHFTVPEFCVVTTRAFTDYQNHKEINPALEDELRKTLVDFIKKGPIAVRSSSTTEDLRGTSFAGMYTTVLDVNTIEDGIEAIMRVWESNDSARVKNYRDHMNLTPGAMAVIIQHQLNPDVSGVMVTQSPFSVNEMMCECCRGLGEKLVSGKITPTRYRIKGYSIIERKGNHLLSKHQLRNLVEVGKKIEQIFKSPQDIEWAIDDETLYILQARPITVHASMPRRPGRVWCNVNVRETIPDPVSPMAWSILETILFPHIMMKTFGIPIKPKQYEKFPPVELLSGRLYWNMNNTMSYGKSIGPILDVLEGSEAIDPQMTTAFKAVDSKNLPRPLSTLTMLKFSAVSIFRLTFYTVISFFRHKAQAKKIADAYEVFEVSFSQVKLVDDLILSHKNIKRLVWGNFTRRYFGGVFLSICYLIILSKLLALRSGKEGEATARKTIVGIIDKTGEMVMALKNLAAVAQRKHKRMTMSGVKKLYKQDKEFKKVFDAFIRDFGHRGPAEFDIASPNWREDYDMVYRLIATSRNTGEQHLQREAMIDDILRSAKPFEKFILELFIPRIEVFTPLRENGKHIFLKVAGRAKDQLLHVEKMLITKGYLKQRRDIFFLTLDDIDTIATDRPNREDILRLVETRKREWHAYRQTEAPDIIYESGERITAAVTASNVLSGEPLSFGRVKARVRIIRDFNESQRLRKGEILVTHHTDPGWTPLFTVAAGVIIEVGGVICHAAMVARELGIPAIVVKGATTIIPDRSMVELDAHDGWVKIVSNKKLDV
jgi:pyruvate,water dikinase